MTQARLKMLTKRLTLTEDQQTKVKPILEQQAKDIKALRSSSDFASLSRQDKMAKVKTINDKVNDQIKALLTNEQKTKWDAMLKQQQQRQGQQRGGRSRSSE